MLHRDKKIGKSLYRIVKHDGEGYRVMEIYNDGKTFAKAYSNEQWDRVDDALQQLTLIDKERFYTDPFNSAKFNI